MMIRLAIIGAVLLAGGIIFSNEINQLLPQTSSNFINSVTSDFGKITDETIQKAETNVGVAIETASNEVKDFTESSADQLSENIKELTDSTQEVIFFGTLANDQNENSQSVERHASESSPTGIEGTTVESSPTGIEGTTVESFSTITKSQTQTFETLSLTTTQQVDDSVILHYEDTSRKTISVTVTLRTSEKELFSGIFHTSIFETLVNDAINTPYFIDMIVEHEDYGTISSSVFNSGETPDTIINGVFSQS